MVASLKRWGEFGARGSLLMKNATSLTATGKYEITLVLSEPNGAWKNLLAYPEGGPVIYPAAIVSAASTVSPGATMRGGSGTRPTSTTLSRAQVPRMMSSGMSR